MANLNTALTPAPVVTVRYKDGTPVTSYTGNVTVELSTNPTNATLSGTTTVAASAGVATFSNLTLNRSGKGFTLLATAEDASTYALRPIISRPFTIATRLVFTTQPTSVSAPYYIIPLFTVTAQDGAGNTDTAYTGEVTVALYTGAGLGILSGLFTRTAVAGVADFSGLSIDASGDYSLRATGTEVTTAYAPAPVISNTFAVGVLSLTISSNQTDYNVYDGLVAKYGVGIPSSPLIAININSSIIISASNTSTPAFSFAGSWSGTPRIIVNNFGYIIGRGGNGGVGSAATSTTFTVGGNGGPAIDQSGLYIAYVNSSGYIWGGGGGGGGGGRLNISGVGTAPTGGADLAGGGGAAGAGITWGAGGGAAGTGDQVSGTAGLDSTAQAGANQADSLILQVGIASNINSNGRGGISSIPGYGQIGNMYGGGSGGYGEAGEDGRPAGQPGSVSGAAGGAAGKAIELNGGIAEFFSGGSSPNVKGAVS